MFFMFQPTPRGAAGFPSCLWGLVSGRCSDSFRAGIRLGIPYAVVAFVLSMSFGVLARQAGFSALQAIVTAAIIFAGSAQFAGLAVLASGGTAAAAIAAGTLMNGRFLAMGTALAPSLPGRTARAGAAGPGRGGLLVGAGQPRRRHLRPVAAVRDHVPQYVTWLLGTVVGALRRRPAAETPTGSGSTRSSRRSSSPS